MIRFPLLGNIHLLLMCSATVFLNLMIGAYNGYDLGKGVFLVQNLAANSTTFIQLAIENMLSALGKPFVVLALLFFSFATTLACYQTETNAAYFKGTLHISGLTLAL